MHFAIIATDKENSAELRQATRQAHLDYVRGSGKMEMGAPFIGTDGGMNGSLILINVADRAEAEAFVANDPYNQAGLFASVEIRQFKKP